MIDGYSGCASLSQAPLVQLAPRPGAPQPGAGGPSAPACAGAPAPLERPVADPLAAEPSGRQDEHPRIVINAGEDEVTAQALASLIR